MRTLSLIAACLTLVPAGIGEQPKVPVLLELFTSEGCSSCPPADRVLAKIDSDQPVPGADVIVLSEHVDYWNQLGWKDPFSSAQYTERQQAYSSSLRAEVYTPQLVIDGARAMVGSEQYRVYEAVKAALKTEKIPVMVDVVKTADAGKATVRVHTEGADGQVWLALAHDREQSLVTRGENAGHGLAHVGVVYSLTEIGSVKASASFVKEITVNVKPGSGTRVVAFVSRGGSMRVAGVGQAHL